MFVPRAPKTLLPTLAILFCACFFISETRLAANVRQADMLEVQQHYDAAKKYLKGAAYSEALLELEALLKTAPDFAPAWLLKGQALIGMYANEPALSGEASKSDEARNARTNKQEARLRESAESFEKYLQLKPESDGANQLRQQIADLRLYAEYRARPEAERTLFSPNEVTSKARLLSKPEPGYPEEARRAHVNGIIKLIVVLDIDKRPKHILVLQGLSHGLTEEAIEAASKIKFEPAIKDGRPVAMVVWVEYQFQTY